MPDDKLTPASPEASLRRLPSGLASRAASGRTAPDEIMAEIVAKRLVEPP
jgi:hypothetical protein